MKYIHNKQEVLNYYSGIKELIIKNDRDFKISKKRRGSWFKSCK